jgi:hypothetical protein
VYKKLVCALQYTPVNVRTWNYDVHANRTNQSEAR